MGLPEDFFPCDDHFHHAFINSVWLYRFIIVMINDDRVDDVSQIARPRNVLDLAMFPFGRVLKGFGIRAGVFGVLIHKTHVVVFFEQERAGGLVLAQSSQSTYLP